MLKIVLAILGLLFFHIEFIFFVNLCEELLLKFNEDFNESVDCWW